MGVKKSNRDINMISTGDVSIITALRASFRSSKIIISIQANKVFDRVSEIGEVFIEESRTERHIQRKWYDEMTVVSNHQQYNP